MKFCNCRRILDIYSQGLLRTRINLSVLSGSNWNLSVGFWRERKTGAPREKPLGKAEKHEQTYPSIHPKHEKGRSLPFKAIIGSTSPPTPGRRKASALITAPLLLSFRQKPIYLLYLFSLLYLHKKVSSFMSISLLINHNNYFQSLYLFISLLK